MLTTLLGLLFLSPSCAPYSATMKTMAVSTIKDYSIVQDAGLTQKGCKLSLVLIVNPSITKARAKEMGDNFVRMVKSFGAGPSPTKIIGRGIYDYMIGVYSPYDKSNPIVLGAKVSTSPRISL